MLRSGLLKKSLALIAVLMALVVGLRMIDGVSRDRVAQRAYAVQSVQQSAARPQTTSGPVISRKCVEESVETKVVGGKTLRETVREDHMLRAFPDLLDWRGSIGVEARRGSLYTVNTYRAAMVGRATFSNLKSLTIPTVQAPRKISCGAPRLDLLLSHQSGIQSAEIKLDGVAATLDSSVSIANAAGFSVLLSDFKEPTAASSAMKVDVKLDLLGMDSASMLPVGNDNTVTLASAWPHPSFVGAFLPREKKISDAGFTASWRVSSLATDAQASFPCGVVRTGETRCAEGMTVNLIDPVNASVLSERAVKYGELFIALTSVGIGLFELLRRVKVHPVQYLLIGAALAVFFVLLLSVSEHVPFAWAYLLAATGCTLLIGAYATSVLGVVRAALPRTGGCAPIYAVLYLVPQSEQHALLAGSLLIFAVLAAVMLSTRHTRWGAAGVNEPTVKA